MTPDQLKIQRIKEILRSMYVNGEYFSDDTYDEVMDLLEALQ